MSKNFKNRSDYINIQAYGLGKIQTKEHDCGHFDIIESEKDNDSEEEKHFSEMANKEKRLYKRIQRLGNQVKNIKASVCCLAERQDERFEMVFGQKQPDDFQLSLTEKLYNNDPVTLQKFLSSPINHLKTPPTQVSYKSELKKLKIKK